MKFGVAVTTSVNPAVTLLSRAGHVRRLAPVVEEAGFDYHMGQRPDGVPRRHRRSLS